MWRSTDTNSDSCEEMMIARKLYKAVQRGKFRVYEVPVKQGEHIAEVFLRGEHEDARRLQALQYLALFAAAPKLLQVAKLALAAVSHSNEDWRLRVRPLLEEAVAEAEDCG